LTKPLNDASTFLGDALFYLYQEKENLKGKKKMRKEKC